MNKEEFITTATNITEELGLTKEQANAIANIVVILEKNNPNTILTN